MAPGPVLLAAGAGWVLSDPGAEVIPSVEYRFLITGRRDYASHYARYAEGLGRHMLSGPSGFPLTPGWADWHGRNAKPAIPEREFKFTPEHRQRISDGIRAAHAARRARGG